MGVFWIPVKNGNFEEKDKRKIREVHCKLCPKRINYQGNTTNMYLQYNHCTEFLKVKAKVSTATSQKSNQQPSITESFEQLQLGMHTLSQNNFGYKK